MLKPLVLLWLAGASLRITVLAIPPVIPQIHDAFAMSQAAIGALMSLPVLLFSFAAIPGAALIARMGAVRVVTLGLFLTAIGGAMRGLSADTAMLFTTTFFMGAGVAFMQPALPAVARQWLPQRVALGIATYSNGLLVGEAISASLTIPVVLPAVHGDWRWSLAVWSFPVIVVALAFLRPPARGAALHASEVPRRWWPDWRDPLTWGAGILAGYASGLYYAVNAFLPDYLAARGRADLLNASLTALNWAQLPASFLMLAYADRLTMRRWPFLALGTLSLIAVTGLMAMADGWLVGWSGVIGFCNAFLLILTLAMPPLMARPEDVPRLSAAMLLVGYLIAFAVPILGGLAWDASGAARAAFVPLLACGAVSLVIAARLRFRDHRGNP
jgi:MFS transporter, CP family, cyanate transporter